MNSAINKITKFLRLEAERGFDDRAVVGGLGNMLDPWKTEAQAAGLEEDLISAVESRLLDYDRLSPGSRSDVLKGLWKRLQSAEPELGSWTFSDADRGRCRRSPRVSRPAATCLARAFRARLAYPRLRFCE